MTINDRTFSYLPKGKPLSYKEVGAEMRELEERYPNSTEIVTIGTTEEGRDIQALRVSNGIAGDTSSKPGVVITEERFSRRISPESTLKLAHNLLESGDEETRKLLDQQEIWIVPIVNPDSYELTREGGSWWKKNSHGVRASDLGVDLNRNYGQDDYLLAGAPVSGVRTPEEQFLDFTLSHKNIHSMVTLPNPDDSLVLYPWGAPPQG